MTYRGIKTYANGTTITADFATYYELLAWLVESPEAEVKAFKYGEEIESGRLMLQLFLTREVQLAAESQYGIVA